MDKISMQNDLISRQSLMAHFEISQDLVNDRDLLYCNGVLSVIEREPSIDAVPVVHARWEDESDGYRNCSKCGCEHPMRDARGFYVDDNYCPNCGAKMDAKE